MNLNDLHRLPTSLRLAATMLSRGTSAVALSRAAPSGHQWPHSQAEGLHLDGGAVLNELGGAQQEVEHLMGFLLYIMYNHIIIYMFIINIIYIYIYTIIIYIYVKLNRIQHRRGLPTASAPHRSMSTL